jgi:hypothetical protein
VIVNHVGWDSYGTSGWWSIKPAELDTYENAVTGYNVLAIFVGHDHQPHNYKKFGKNVFAAQAEGKKAGTDGFLVVQLSADSLRVGQYNYTTDNDTLFTGGTWAYIYRHAITPPPPLPGGIDWDDW